MAFGSGYFGWAFTLTRFAKIYSQKFKVDQDKMMTKLWSDNFFDAKAKVWRTNDTAADGTQLKRAFVQFIMDPIIRLARNVMEGNIEVV